MTFTPLSKLSQSGLKNTLVGCAYFICVVMTLLLSPGHEAGVTVYPPPGVALGLLLAFGYGVMPGLVLGVFASMLLLGQSSLAWSGNSTLGMLGLSLAALVQATFAYFALREVFSKRPMELVNVRDIALFVIVGGLLSTVIMPTLGFVILSSMADNTLEPSGSLWFNWWVAEAIGVIFFVPFVFCFCQRDSQVWRLRRLPLSIPLFLAPLVLGVILAMLQGLERNSVERQLQSLSQSIQRDLTLALMRSEENILSLGRFYTNRGNVSDEEFQDFASHLMNKDVYTMAVSWNPLVRRDVLESYATAVGASRGQDFTVRPLVDLPAVQGQLPDWAVVIENIFPKELEAKVLGADMSVEPTRLAVLRHALWSRQIVASAPVKLANYEYPSETSSLLVNPVYQAKAVSGGVDQVSFPNGFTVMVLNITRLLKDVMAQQVNQDVRVSLSDITEGQEKTFAILNHASQLADGNFENRTSFAVAGRIWQLSVHPSTDFLATNEALISRWFSYLSLPIAITLLFFLLSVSSRNYLVRREVADKTALLESIRATQAAYVESRPLSDVIAEMLPKLRASSEAVLVAHVTLKDQSDQLTDLQVLSLDCDEQFSEGVPGHLRNAYVRHVLSSLEMRNSLLMKESVSACTSNEREGLSLVCPWNNGQGREALIFLLDHRVPTRDLSQLEALREALESTALAINEREQNELFVQDLKEKTALLENAEHVLKIGTWKLDHVTHEYRFSNEVYRLLGIDPATGTIEPDDFLAVTHQEDRNALFTAYRKSIKENKAVTQVKHRIVNPVTLEVRHIQESFQHHYDESGKLCSSTGISVDITDQVQREQQLIAQAERAQAQRTAIAELSFDTLSPKHSLTSQFEMIAQRVSQVFDVSRVGVWLFSADRSVLECKALTSQGQLVKADSSTVEYERYPSYFEHMMQHGSVAVDDVQSAESMRELLADYLPERDISSLLDVGIINDGILVGVLSMEHIGEQRQWRTDEVLFASTIAALIGQSLEAYERTELLKQLVKQRSEQEKILNAMVDSVVSIDHNGTILSANDATFKLFGYAPFELIGQNVSMLMPSEEAAQHQSHLRRYQKNGQARIIGKGREVYARRRDGERFPIRLSVAELDAGDPDARLYVGAIHDLTLEQKQRDQIQRTQKMDALGQITGGIAHDFNNILGVMLGYTEMLREFSVDMTDQQKKYIQQIEMGGERAKALIKKMRSFSTKDSSELKVVSINQCLRDAHLMIEKAITTRNTLSFDFASDLWATSLDQSDFENVVLNLSVNAMHAMPHGGTLCFTTWNLFLGEIEADSMGLKEGDYVCLSVRDTGEGMTPEVKERIFEPFFSTKGERGTGLGLAQLYGFMKRSSGAVNVYSELGEGTEFKLYFPKAQEELKQASNTKRQSVESLGGHECVLVVDDEESLREVIAEKLRLSGYQVIEACDGVEAMQLLKQHDDVKAVISDIIMPNMDGVQLANLIGESYPELKIILCSGFSDMLHDQLNDQSLFQKRLVKPFNFQELLQRLRALLDQTLGTLNS